MTRFDSRPRRRQRRRSAAVTWNGWPGRARAAARTVAVRSGRPGSATAPAGRPPGPWDRDRRPPRPVPTPVASRCRRLNAAPGASVPRGLAERRTRSALRRRRRGCRGRRALRGLRDGFRGQRRLRRRRARPRRQALWALRRTTGCPAGGEPGRAVGGPESSGPEPGPGRPVGVRVLGRPERLVQLRVVQPRIVERPATPPVRQRQPGRRPHVRHGHRGPPGPGRVGDRRAGGDQVTAQPVHAQRRAGPGDPQQLSVAQLDPARQRAGRGDAAGQLVTGRVVRRGADGRVPVVAQPGPHGVGPAARVGAGHHGHAQPEPVQQLRAQLALLRVHRPDEQEPAGVPQRDALPLDHRGAGGGRVQHHVDQVVGQQVDLVHVQHAAVRLGQQAGHERLGGRRAGQHPGHVQAAGDPVVGRAQRQLHQPGGPVLGGRAGRRVRAVRAAGSGAAGSQENRHLATTLMPGRMPVSARTRVVLAVPFSPVSSTPPRPGSTAPSSSASRASSCPTTAENGSPHHRVTASSWPSTSRYASRSAPACPPEARPTAPGRPPRAAAR